MPAVTEDGQEEAHGRTISIVVPLCQIASGRAIQVYTTI